MKNEKTLLPNLGLAPFCKSRGMTLQIAQLQQMKTLQPSHVQQRQFSRCSGGGCSLHPCKSSGDRLPVESPVDNFPVIFRLLVVQRNREYAISRSGVLSPSHVIITS